MKSVPRVVIASVRSGAGKTSIATGLMGALTCMGYRVQGFKVGPDYIDPSYHTAVTGRWSRNLDTWLLSYSQVRRIFWHAVADADLAVVEGVMGLFDGLRGKGEQASTAELAKLLGCPVILVLDVRAQARSAVVEALGCRAFDPALSLAGVILNRVHGPRHLEMLRESFLEAGGIPVLGVIQEGSLPVFEERHLGLVPVSERQEIGPVLTELVEKVTQQVDLKAVLEVARTAPGFSVFVGAATEPRSLQEGDQGAEIRVAFAWDEAFSFYYRDSLNCLREFGIELVPFSPLRDRELPPEIGGILLGGGFPELFAEQLAANTEMRGSIREAHAQGIPIYAECGGLMYLCENLVDQQGRSHSMVGLVPGSCEVRIHLVGMGYVAARALGSNLLCGEGEVLRGHEFHYSSFIPHADPFPWAFSFTKGGQEVGLDGYFSGNLLASHLHFHFASEPRAAARFAACCRNWLF